MAEQSKLEKIAIETRNSLLPKNTYKDTDSDKYSATHTRALSDSTTPVQGKGTGIYMDTYNGGGDLDINGNPEIVGSGRVKNKAMNAYNENKQYTHPDMSGNIGQVNVE